MYEDDFSLLVGKTLTRIDVTDEEVLFICDDDSAFRAYHMQDCRETVGIHDISGDPNSLIGSRIVESKDIVSDEWPVDVRVNAIYVDSFTWTTHRIKTESGQEVSFRWLGESNGYYSESVYLTRTHMPITQSKENQ